MAKTTEAKPTAEVIRAPLMSGHCAVGNKTGHERCRNNGGYQRANPNREFQPCPCKCHYVDEDGLLSIYECGSCGGEIVEAAFWPFDEDGDVRYAHIDHEGRVLGEDCTRSAPAPTKKEKRESRDCVRCGGAVDIVDSRVCKRCIKIEADERAAAAAAEDDFADLDDL